MQAFRSVAALLLMLPVSAWSAHAAPGTARHAATPPCACVELFDALVARVEADYPGYHLEVRGTAAEDGYRRRTEAMRQRAAASEMGLPCVRVLQGWLAGFEEGHLFVGGRPPVETAADSAALREAAPRVAWSEDDVHQYLDDSAGRLDPVEGVWVDAAGQMLAVVRAGMDAGPARATPGPSRFVAFVLISVTEAWQPGDVRAELEALPDGSYDAVLYDDVRAATRPHVYKRGMAGGARLQREGLLLHMPPVTWGKLHPVAPGQEGLIDVLDPRAPTARTVGAHTVVFHVPSNVPSHAPRLRALVERYRGALSRADNLIIDVRGNEGGSTFVTNVLMPYLVTPGKRPARYLAEGESAVLAAEDNIGYFSRVGWAPPGLVARLEAADPGTLVPFADPDAEEADDSETTDVAMPRPRNVGILTDAMTVSAAEAFVLRAMRNEKVTLFGEATGSSIDYQTVSIVRFGCREAGLYLGYPTIVGSDQLPEDGVRPTGIVPDVPLDPADPDPIGSIIEYYATR